MDRGRPSTRGPRDRGAVRGSAEAPRKPERGLRASTRRKYLLAGRVHCCSGHDPAPMQGKTIKGYRYYACGRGLEDADAHGGTRWVYVRENVLLRHVESYLNDQGVIEGSFAAGDFTVKRVIIERFDVRIRVDKARGRAVIEGTAPPEVGTGKPAV